jgi:hypothetical protein
VHPDKGFQSERRFFVTPLARNPAILGMGDLFSARFANVTPQVENGDDLCGTVFSGELRDRPA